jgi:L-cysteate sulfo-lyase
MMIHPPQIEPLKLATWPTPVEPASRLAVALGLGPDDLWIKRDDLTGVGAGGNKLRKLQYTCADALRARATTLVTSGAAQSNHARLTAAVAARLGLRCVLVLDGEPPREPRGNVILDHLAGANVTWAGRTDAQGLELQVDSVVTDLRNRGEAPYVIPFGGSTPLAAYGYVDGASELIAQLPAIDNVVVAVGSGATMAGLVARLGSGRVIGIDTGAVPDATRTVTNILAGMCPRSEHVNQLQINHGQVGEGYGTLTPAADRAMALAAQTEGIFLDPTYTARALAGLTELVAKGQIRTGQRTVFLHTGGLPGLFGHAQLSHLTG